VPGAGALLEGVLVFDAESGCFWLEPGGEGARPSGGRVSTRWPKGFSARLDPPRVLDGDGEVMAQPGDFLSTGGGFSGRPLDDCQLSEETWSISEVGDVRSCEEP
jgi:hypothetical protein